MSLGKITSNKYYFKIIEPGVPLPQIINAKVIPKLPVNAQKQEVYDLTGKLVKVFDSITEAAKHYGQSYYAFNNYIKPNNTKKFQNLPALIGLTFKIIKSEINPVLLPPISKKEEEKNKSNRPKIKIAVYDLDGNLLKICASASEVVTDFNIGYSRVYRYKDTGESYKGYIFKTV